MPESPTCTRAAYVRSVVTTILLILLAILIVRDVFVRRWGSPLPPAT